MEHTITECILIMQTLLISCHAWSGIIVDTEIAKGGTQLIRPNQAPYDVNVSFSLPNLMSSKAVTLPDGCVYFLGGYAGALQKTVKRFDPATNTSTDAT